MSANCWRRPKWRCAGQRRLAIWRSLGRKRSPNLSPRGWFFSRLPMRGVGIGGIIWMLHEHWLKNQNIDRKWYQGYFCVTKFSETDTEIFETELSHSDSLMQPAFFHLSVQRTKWSINTLSTSFSTVYFIGKPAGPQIPIAVLLKISAALFSSGQDRSTYPRTTSKDTVRVI